MNDDDPAPLLYTSWTERAVSKEELAERFEVRRTPGYLVRRLDSRASALYEAYTDQSALTTRQFGLLKIVYDVGPVRQSELAGLLDLDRSTLGEMLNRMVDRGLVVRRAAQGDKRTSEIDLTDEGRSALLANVSGAVEAQIAFLDPLPTYLRPVFMKCLEILAEQSGEADDDDTG